MKKINTRYFQIRLIGGVRFDGGGSYLLSSVDSVESVLPCLCGLVHVVIVHLVVPAEEIVSDVLVESRAQ